MTGRQLVEQVVLAGLQAFYLNQDVGSVSFHCPGMTIGAPVFPICEGGLGHERTDTGVVGLLAEMSHLFIGHSQIGAQA